MIKTIIAVALPIAAIASGIAYDLSEQTSVYKVGHDWNGYAAVYEYKVGRLGFESTHGENIGYFGGGNPRVIGFGCEGKSAPVVAVEEDELPRCQRVEGIANHREEIEFAN